MYAGTTWHAERLDSWLQQSAPTDGDGARITEYPAAIPPHVRLWARADDVAPKTPTANPRAQLVGLPVIDVGGTYRCSVDLLVPATALPATIDRNAGAWVEFVQFAYGPPHAGSPPLRIMTQDAVSFGLREADAATYAWQVPLKRDTWWRIVCEFRHATDGWYRLLVCQGLGTPVEVIPQKSYATVQASNNGGPNAMYLDAYMSAGTAPRVGPFFFANARVDRIA